MTRTYVTRSRGRGDAEVLPHDLTYTDTVDFDARTVRSTVIGYSEGERVSVTTTRSLPDDWNTQIAECDAIRAKQGWRIVEAPSPAR